MAQHASLVSTHKKAGHFSWRMLFGLLVVAVVLYIVLPHLSIFKQSFTVLHHAQLGWLGVALLCVIGSSLAATAMYCILAKKPLRYARTLLVQVASIFVNRLAPGGIGAVSINFDYLRKQHHSTAEAGSVVAVNNLLGLIGNLLLLAVAILIAPVHLKHTTIHHSYIYWLAIAVVVVLVVVVSWSRHLRQELYKTLFGIVRNVLKYRAHPLRIGTGLLVSMALTLFYTGCLAAAGQALHVPLSLAQAVVIMTAGVAVGTLTPTPGGLVGTEAGVFAGCLAYHVSSAQALDIALLYRLFTYWLALPFGALALIIAERRGYV